MSGFEINIYRKNFRWVAALNGGIVVKGWTLKGVERGTHIAAMLATLPDGGKGTL